MATKRITGARIPKTAGVTSEVTQYTMQAEFCRMKKSFAYSVTLEQHLFIKSHGGSEFLRDLVSWFAEQEKKAVNRSLANIACGAAKGTEEFGAFMFDGVPVLIDRETRTPLWETYFWAKENNAGLKETAQNFSTN